MSVSSAASRNGIAAVLARYPLISYFLIALAFSWVVILVVLRLGLPTTMWTIVAITLGPTVASLVMTSVLEGAAGIRRLLGRLVLWQVGWQWYVVALLGIPAIFVFGTVFLPGAAASFDPLTLDAWLSYPWTFLLVVFVGGPLLEEIGWRGFALPRLERRFGPLAGTIVLGLIWAAWHYPQYMMPDWAAQNGGFHLASVAVFTVGVLLFTVVFTWVFNNTRGSLLLAILLHGSINTFSLYVFRMFPSEAESQVNAFIGFGVATALIVLLTRGRLSYDRYLAETLSEERGEGA